MINPTASQSFDDFLRDRMRVYLEGADYDSCLVPPPRLLDALFGDDARIDSPTEQYPGEYLDLLRVAKSELGFAQKSCGPDDADAFELDETRRVAVIGASPLILRRGLLAYLKATCEGCAAEDYEALRAEGSCDGPR